MDRSRFIGIVDPETDERGRPGQSTLDLGPSTFGRCPESDDSRSEGRRSSVECRISSKPQFSQPGKDRRRSPAILTRFMTQYLPRDIEEKWQQRWAEAKVAEVDVNAAGDKFYMLNMFPYPSGDLHVGHGRNYILGDVLFRFFRMKGRVSLNPMGWDAFGLPAENAAIKRGIHPREWTLGNIQRMKRQFARWGILYDWSKEIASCEPAYYHWNQWLFLRLYEKGLAYRGKAPVNWCPQDLTVLANEQVIDGRCERCGAEVVQKELEQWFFRITDYADRLDAGLDTLEHWPDKVKTMQRN